MREFEPPAWAPQPDTRIAIVKMHAACNWAQVLEGSIDSAHSSSLHSTNMPAGRGGGLDRHRHRLAASVQRQGAAAAVRGRPTTASATPRSAGRSATPRPTQYVRTTLFIAPFTVLIPPNDQYNLAQMLVPIDDVNTHVLLGRLASRSGEGHRAGRVARVLRAPTSGVDLDANCRKKRNLENRYLQDREAMKRGDFTGIKGIPAQDMAMWESMGPITDRSEDHLGSSDLAVAQFRRMMVAAAENSGTAGRPSAPRSRACRT